MHIHLAMVSAQAVFPLAMVLFSSAVVLQGCGGGGGTQDSSNIPAIAEKTKDLTQLVAALKEAGLIKTLEGPGPFTVFAPSDAAFDALPSAELTYLFNTKPALTEVLEYHVTTGSILSSALTNGEKITMLKGGDVTVTIVNNSNASTTTVMINDANVTTANVEASNGVVHIIDKVLIPPNFTAPTIPQVAVSANLSTLVTAVTAGDLGTALSANGLTLFAPSNKAFDDLPAGVLQALLKPENVDALKKVLTYHVVASEILGTDFTNGEQIPTLEGQNINITIDGTKEHEVSVNAANVTGPNVFAINGVVHIIDAVLLPPGFSPPTRAPSALAVKIVV